MCSRSQFAQGARATVYLPVAPSGSWGNRNSMPSSFLSPPPGGLFFGTRRQSLPPKAGEHAVRQAGELLREIEPAPGERTDLPRDVAVPRLTRKSAADAAGMSGCQGGSQPPHLRAPAPCRPSPTKLRSFSDRHPPASRLSYWGDMALIITPSTPLRLPLAAGRASLAESVAVFAVATAAACGRGVARTTAYGNVRRDVLQPWCHPNGGCESCAWR